MLEAGSLTPLLKILTSSDPTVQSNLLIMVNQLVNAIEHPTDLLSKIPYLPKYTYEELDRYLRFEFLPSKLTPSGRNALEMFLRDKDNWHVLLELVPTLEARCDRIWLTAGVAHMEVWRRYHAPPPSGDSA